MRNIERGLLAMLLTAILPASGRAQTQGADLAHATLEDLMNIEITSASRKEQRLETTAAAVFVITQDDIRRSGMTTVPDLLRLVPGAQVAQVNATTWAVGLRGLNSAYSNKLLVLVDGRSIYTPLFSTVLWDSVDVVLEDIARIEVIRGPGGAVWGANAVNGVINIVTKSAGDAQGLLVRAGTGTADPGRMAVRYGGLLGRAAYRVYSQWSDHAASPLTSDVSADDRWNTLTNGARLEWGGASNGFMVDGAASTTKEHSLWIDPTYGPWPNTVTLPSATNNTVGHVLARWTRSGEEGQADQLQAYFDGATLNEPVGQYKRRTLDVDAQHHAIFGRRHDVIVGGGYRFIDETYLGLAGYSVSRPAANEHLVNAFGQDEIAMAANRVRVSVGAKVEYDTYVGGGIQPTGRVIWDLRPRQHVWAAASRALRTPSLIDHSFRLTFGPTLGYAGGLPIIAGVVGNPDFHSETLADVETGYRIDLGTMATLDVAGFVSAYQGLEVQTPIAPRLELSPTPHILAGATMTNGMEADTRGLEIAFRAQPLAPWRFDATYSAYRMTSALDPGVVLARQVPIDGNAPRAQWRIGSSYAIGTIGDLNAQLFHVGRLEAIGIAPYTRMDLRVNLRMGSHFTASFGGQNLLQATHAEFTGQSGNTIGTLVPRSGGMQLTWRQ